MRSISRHFAGDEISGFEVCGIFGQFQRDTAAFELAAQVGDAPVVDVFVGSF